MVHGEDSSVCAAMSESQSRSAFPTGTAGHVYPRCIVLHVLMRHPALALSRLRHPTAWLRNRSPGAVVHCAAGLSQTNGARNIGLHARKGCFEARVLRTGFLQGGVTLFSFFEFGALLHESKHKRTDDGVRTVCR